jgi:hypothetical protein
MDRRLPRNSSHRYDITIGSPTNICSRYVHHLLRRKKVLEPHWVQFHDGAGGSHPMLVTQHGAEDHVGGFVLCTNMPATNDAGLEEGWNKRVHIGRGDVSKGASWSPVDGLDPGEED